MANVPTHHFTHSHIVSDDGTVAFKCATDVIEWPWLALPVCNPIVVQSLNYFASVEAGLARGTYDPTKWTALTEMAWVCDGPESGPAVHGVAETNLRDELPYFKLKFFDENDAQILSMTGKGVVFRTRDFEGWREKAKQNMTAPADVSDFQFAPAGAVSVGTQCESYVSPIRPGDAVTADGLITKASGFMPGHPYHSGSGDHVNANHLADVGCQFACLVTEDASLRCLQGEVTFARYVELGRPFEITLTDHAHAENRLSIAVHQAGRLCASMRMQYAPLN